MAQLVSGSVIVLGLCGLVCYGQCEPGPAVQRILNKMTTDETAARRRQIAEGGLAAHPDDFFLLRASMDNENRDDRDAAIGRAKALYDKHPDKPAYTILYARALEGKDTPQAIRILEAVESAHPDAAQAYLELSRIVSWGKFKDKARAQSELGGFLKVCPATLDGAAMRQIAGQGTAEQISRAASAVRNRLATEADPSLSDAWESLWRLEFKAHPPAEHGALRKQIGNDVERFEKAPQRHEVDWMTFLREGYKNAGDLAAVERINDDILKEHPASQAADSVREERWRKQHPFPTAGTKEEQEAYYRARLVMDSERVKRSPGNSMIRSAAFTAMANLPDTSADQITRAADELLSAYRKNPNWYSLPPVEFSVADAFIKRKVRLSDVPALVDEGYRAALARHGREIADDRYDDEYRKAMRETFDWLMLERARVLLSAYAEAKQPEKAREIEAELATLSPSKPGGKSRLLERRAYAAEIQGRKLDALMLYRAAVEARGATPPPRDGDTAMQGLERLWKELGGTPAGYALLIERPRPSEATDSRWERPKNPLPAFALSDLEGKTWTLASLEGKAVLINVWSTWCGPCRMEHPEFQKLYDKFKSRSDIAVLSFNVDEDLGKVAPYMQENKYTFPVIPAREVVDAVVPLLSIPRNWFISPKGKLEWEQVGFGSDPKWQEAIIGKVEEVLKMGR